MEDHMKDQKNGMDRRTFLKTTGVGGASMALATGLSGNLLAAESGKGMGGKKVPTRILGKTGVPVSMLALGGIDWTTNQNLLRMGIEMGATLLDTSDRYENGKSEIGIGQYLGRYPEDRKKLFISTKVTDLHTPKQVSDSIDSSLKNMQTDYIDLYLLSAIDTADNLTPDLAKMVEKKKKEGKIRFFGFSTHIRNDQILPAAAALGWIDVVMLTYNYVVMQKDEVKRGVEACAKAGLGLIAIKSQAKTPDIKETPEELKALKHFMDKGYTVEQAKLKAVWSDDRIASICSDITNLTILRDNVAAAADSVKLTASDFRVLNRMAEAVCSGGYCQGCGKCIAAMGAEYRIPDVMRYMMYYNSYGERDRARGLFRELPASLRESLASKDYTPAESACPHRLEIGKIMRKASGLLA